MVDVQRKQGESIGSLLRRFSRFIQQSKVVIKAKQSQFNGRKPTERKQKQAAIMGLHLSALRRRLEKLGAYSDEAFDEAKRRLKQEIDL